jgi:predicted MPP superfamily phosphohydrolase
MEQVMLSLLHRLHLLPDMALMLIGLGAQAILLKWIWERPEWRSGRRLGLLLTGNFVLAVLELAQYIFSFHRLRWMLSTWMITWIQALGLIAAIVLTGFLFGGLALRTAPLVSLPRRRFLQTAGVACISTPFVATGFGIVSRNRFELNEVKVPIPNLPKDLDGLKLVQVTDIHLSPFLSEREFARAIDMANETKAHIALVTGDLITRAGDPLEACLRQLARLRADAGVLGCLGNHEIYANCENFVAEAGKRIGIDFLRYRARSLKFGNASINFAGVDFQSFYESYLVGADLLVAPGQVNVLLSHNPDVFPVAAKQGFDLTIGGHTHGGQVNVEILHENVNVALYMTKFVRGLYRMDNSAVYVSSGIGTIGVPVRVGAPAEVSLIRLCAS